MSEPSHTTSLPEHAAPSIDGSDRNLLRAAVQRAVDFRGDVTIETADGRAIEGYAFDARLGEEGESIRVLPIDSGARVEIALARIRRLSFTGKDAASGKSWENWIRRYAEKKLAGEQASIESEVL